MDEPFPGEYFTPLKLLTSATYGKLTSLDFKKTKETSAASQGELSAEKLFDNTAVNAPKKKTAVASRY